MRDLLLRLGLLRPDRLPSVPATRAEDLRAGILARLEELDYAAEDVVADGTAAPSAAARGRGSSRPRDAPAA